MSDEEIKKQLRHSFTNPFREDLPKPKINQFGHTILTDNEIKEVDLSSFKVEQNPDGSVSLNKDILNAFANNYMVDHVEEDYAEEENIIPVKSDLFCQLISELDDLKEDKSKPFLKAESSNVFIVEESSNVATLGYKNCLNKECMYNLPKDANFCLKCGTVQMSKFCTECGYNFPGMEKFCPDCGTKR
jgi:RNA polymerase subunit RPABC4/transcription elongation factor Spt4